MNKQKQISLGLMRIEHMSVEQVENLVLNAVNHGVNFFDHANIYGQNKCEELFGAVLRKNPTLRSKIVLQSKCGICRGYYDSSKEHIIKEVEGSIKRLNCDYLDILLIHRPDALCDYQELNEAFEYLYNKGLVKEFGVSNFNIYQMELFAKYVKFPIKYNQLQFSIIHSYLISQGLYVNMSSDEAVDRSSGLLEYCQTKDITIQAWSPLMASWEHGSFIDNKLYPELNNKLEELSKKYNVKKNAIAISWILTHPANIIPIVGTTSINHLLEMIEGINIKLTRKEWYELYLANGHKLP